RRGCRLLGSVVGCRVGRRVGSARAVRAGVGADVRCCRGDADVGSREGVGVGDDSFDREGVAVRVVVTVTGGAAGAVTTTRSCATGGPVGTAGPAAASGTTIA